MSPAKAVLRIWRPKSLQTLEPTLLLLLGFTVAVALRIVIGGIGVAQSPVAGLIFAACLASLCLAGGLSSRISGKIVVVGLLGSLVLCLPALIGQVSGNSVHPAGNYLSWSIVVAIVALAEEAFLRGSLYSAVKAWGGDRTAIWVGALAFAVLHIPLYGWRVIPLDLLVGLWLGLLRAKSGSWVAAGIAHTVTDLVAWWL